LKNFRKIKVININCESFLLFSSAQTLNIEGLVVESY